MYQRFTLKTVQPDCIGLPNNLVRLSAYSSEWPELFRGEMQRIANALYPFSVSLAHIGSTAVPGLTAKPIIDILLGLQEPVHSIPVQLTLQSLGYRPHGEKGVPGRLFFTLGDPCKFHLHLVEFNGAIWANHLLFRDCLIADADLAYQYVQVKEELARQFPEDRESYTQGKANFIESAIKKNCDSAESATAT